ncbi:MAG TPA: hypothetical protein VGI39_11610 [Polyangiaceae bacterium]|jgi:Cys-rich repeat protein
MRGVLASWASLGVLLAAAAACGELALNLTLPDASSPAGIDAAADAGGPESPPVVHCAKSADCGDAGAPLCDPDAGVCVQCLSSTDCSGSTPHCLKGTCVSCTTDADCSSGMVCNMHIPRCATQCTSGTECNGRPCATAYGYCVECLSDLDCTTAALPYCYEPPAVGLCVGCRSNADCKGATCGPSFRCATP